MSTTSTPCVLVATPVPALQRLFADALLRERPRWHVRPIEPEAIEARLQRGPAPVVLCTEPTTAIQRYARAWAVLAPAGDR